MRPISIEALIPIVIVIIGALGWLLKRWITGSHYSDDAQSIKTAVELQVWLAEKGLSFHEARALRDALRSGRQPITPAIAEAITQRRPIPGPDLDTLNSGVQEKIDFSETAVGMKMGLSMQLTQLDAEIDFLIASLSNGSTPVRLDAISASHRAWIKFRDKDSQVAALLMEGGTGAPILALSRRVEISEHRRNELQLMVTEESAL